MYEDEEPTPLSSAIVLAEDKKYYPSAEEARGSVAARVSAFVRARRREVAARAARRLTRQRTACCFARCTALARRRW
jgi:hypothetical protein